MASISNISTHDIDIDALLNTNKHLVNQLNTVNAENVIMSEKIRYLTNLCEHHKSKYEQIQNKWQYQYDQQNEKYNVQINSLQHQIQKQHLELDAMQNEIDIITQQSIDSNIKHQKEIQSFKQTLNRYKWNLQHLQRINIDKDTETVVLEDIISQKENEIIELKAKLLTTDCEQCTCYQPARSASTLKIPLSHLRTISYSHISLPSDPNKSRSSIDTATNVIYYNYNDCISSLSELDEISNGNTGSDDIANVISRKRGFAVSYLQDADVKECYDMKHDVISDRYFIENKDTDISLSGDDINDKIENPASYTIECNENKLFI